LNLFASALATAKCYSLIKKTAGVLAVNA